MFLAPISDTALPTGERERTPISSIFVNHHADLARLEETLAGADDGRMPARARRRGARHGQDRAVRRVPADTAGRLAGRPDVLRAMSGACGPVGAWTFPLLDALHHLARQSPSTIPKLLAKSLRAGCRSCRRGSRTRPRRQRRDPTPESSRLIRELSTLLETLSAETTTVMVLEDLHWGDLETIELLRGLARRHAPLRTLILATYSPTRRR